MLSNKLALITGSASGIGKSISKLFAKNGAGLCLVDIKGDNLDSLADEIKNENKEKNISISTHLCDVSNGIEVENLFKSIKQAHESKTPNIIVNSAGIFRESKLIEMSENDFDKVINVNLKGTFFISQIAIRNLLEKLQADPSLVRVDSYASVINIASVIGKYGFPGQVNYAASKSGVEGLTKTIAKEVGKYKIRCNAILPGFIQTPMTEKIPKKILESTLKLIPLRRIGQPEEVAQLALFLASDSSSYINGSIVECTGGLAF